MDQNRINTIAQKYKSNIELIKAILVDVDGTLTNSCVLTGPEIQEQAMFSKRDGYGLKLLQKYGIKLGIITASVGGYIEKRAEALKFDFLYTGYLDKIKAFNSLLEKENLEPKNIAYIGDDYPDIPILKVAGFSGAVNDAMPLVKEKVHYITDQKGGDGAVREFTEVIRVARGFSTEL